MRPTSRIMVGVLQINWAVTVHFMAEAVARRLTTIPKARNCKATRSSIGTAHAAACKTWACMMLL